MKFARQRDVNENEIVAALRAAGATVAKLDGTGVPDLIVSYHGVLTLVEVKNPNAKGGGKYNTGGSELTSAQVKWWAKWTGKPVAVVHTVAEALAAIGAAP